MPEPGKVTLSPRPVSILDDPLPVEIMPEDHPLFGCDVDGLTFSDRAWMQEEFLAFYSESTRKSMHAKFTKFADFCNANDLSALPARPSSIYRYIRFLREEGRVGVWSLPQYLAAISMVHQSMGHLQFSAFDQVTRRLT